MKSDATDAGTIRHLPRHAGHADAGGAGGRARQGEAALPPMPGLKAVLWNVYGTLLAIPFGELVFEHPTQMIMDVALDKTINEFKMWGSMSRKPGAPAEYMRHLYSQELLLLKAAGGGERFPEVPAEKVWEALIKKLKLKLEQERAATPVKG